MILNILLLLPRRVTKWRKFFCISAFKCCTVRFYDRGQLDYIERSFVDIVECSGCINLQLPISVRVYVREGGGVGQEFFVLMCFVQTCLCRRVVVTAVYVITNCLRFVNKI